jgi:predicted nucleic acid-binding protein
MTERTVVLDASAAIRLVVPGPDSERIRLAVADVSAMVAPTLFAAEVTNAAWRLTRARELDEFEALTALADMLAMIDTWQPMTAGLMAAALAAAIDHGHPAYDLIYAATAKLYGAALITADKRLAVLAHELGIQVAP